jgi:hypothetical protein
MIMVKAVEAYMNWGTLNIIRHLWMTGRDDDVSFS